jgi:hypothetical protein
MYPLTGSYDNESEVLADGDTAEVMLAQLFPSKAQESLNTVAGCGQGLHPPKRTTAPSAISYVLVKYALGLGD